MGEEEDGMSTSPWRIQWSAALAPDVQMIPGDEVFVVKQQSQATVAAELPVQHTDYEDMLSWYQEMQQPSWA